MSMDIMMLKGSGDGLVILGNTRISGCHVENST